jgi:hypothetical protein
MGFLTLILLGVNCDARLLRLLRSAMANAQLVLFDDAVEGYVVGGVDLCKS